MSFWQKMIYPAYAENRDGHIAGECEATASGGIPPYSRNPDRQVVGVASYSLELVVATVEWGEINFLAEDHTSFGN